MAIKKLRPITPGQRHRSVNKFVGSGIHKPEKSLIAPIDRSGGRNNTGKMTVRYIGGGHKRSFRIIDFKRDKHGVNSIVKSIEYDPNRSARIALLQYADGEKRYILAPAGLTVGNRVMSGKEATPEVGNAMPLNDMPLGSIVHNVELQPGKGGAMARSAGSYAQLTAREDKYAILRIPSGETRKVLATCMATIGAVSNPEHNTQAYGKAGARRWLGRRPRNRGVAMNPVDHPMGGGEGKASGGHPRSRKGIKAKGFKTRSRKNQSDKYIIERRKKRI